MPVLLAYLAIGAAFLVAQERYYQIHRRHHGAWWPPAQRWFQWPRLDEARAMWSATFRSDAVPEVERARRQYLAVTALAFIGLVVVATSQIPPR